MTSATSGTCSSPPRPTTSTGSPRARSTSASGSASALRRTRTAAVGGGRSSSSATRNSFSIRSAIHSRSSRTVADTANRTSPAVAPGLARNVGTGTPLRRSGAVMWLASSSASGGFRQLVNNSSLGAGPAVVAKSVAKRGRLAADAPRHP